MITKGQKEEEEELEEGEVEAINPDDLDDALPAEEDEADDEEFNTSADKGVEDDEELDPFDYLHRDELAQ